MAGATLLKNSGIYVVVSVLQKAVIFFLLPLYTAFLTPDDFGTVNVVLSISSLLSIFFCLSLQGAAARFHYQAGDDSEKLKSIWGTLCSFVILNSIILGSTIIICHSFLLDPFIKEINFFPLLLLGILNTIFAPLYIFFQYYLQTTQQGTHYGSNMLANFIINVTLIILFVVKFEMGATGILLANVITSIVFFIYTLIIFVPKIKIGINWEILKPAFKYSLPLIPHSLSGWFTGMLDRLFINNITNSAEAGVYSAGYQFGNIVNISSSAVNQAYIPWFFQQTNNIEKTEVSIVNFAEVMTITYCLLAFFISVFSVEVLRLMVTAEYFDAWKVIPLVSFAYVFNGLYYFFINILFLNKTKLVPVVTFTSALISVFLNIVLIPKFGGIGAGISFLVSVFCSSVLALILSYKNELKIRFKWGRMYLYVFVFGLLSAIVYLPVPIHPVISTIIKILFSLLMLTVFFYLYKKKLMVFKNILITR